MEYCDNGREFFFLLLFLGGMWVAGQWRWNQWDLLDVVYA